MRGQKLEYIGRQPYFQNQLSKRVLAAFYNLTMYLLWIHSRNPNSPLGNPGSFCFVFCILEHWALWRSEPPQVHRHPGSLQLQRGSALWERGTVAQCPGRNKGSVVPVASQNAHQCVYINKWSHFCNTYENKMFLFDWGWKIQSLCIFIRHHLAFFFTERPLEWSNFNIKQPGSSVLTTIGINTPVWLRTYGKYSQGSECPRTGGNESQAPSLQDEETDSPILAPKIAPNCIHSFTLTHFSSLHLLSMHKAATTNQGCCLSFS